MSFISYLVNGISLGSVYAIIALGYTMVYGIAKMLNFAHGDVIMVGAYVVMTAIASGGLPPLAAVLLAVVFCTILGVVIESVAYRPLLNAARTSIPGITAVSTLGLDADVEMALLFGAMPSLLVSVFPLHPAAINIIPISRFVIFVIAAKFWLFVRSWLYKSMKL